MTDRGPSERALAHSPKSSATRVVISAGAADAALRGHPWIWQRGIVRGMTGVVAGDEVQVVDVNGAPVGRGIADPESPLSIRLWTRGETPVNAELFSQRIESAFALRRTLFADGRTNAYRLLNGEGDRTPGFVLDRYADFAVLRMDGQGAAAQADAFTRVAWPALQALGVTSLLLREGKKKEVGVEVLHGVLPEGMVETREHGVVFGVDLVRGQKTGAFLDQRENRQRVGGLASSKRVLNLFSYAGGFSLHAALGGAERVTSVDIAAPAHAMAQASFRLADVDPRGHDFVTADAFAFLADAKRKGLLWDVVISDPPSFAPSEKAVPRALNAYRSLHYACTQVLAPGGTFCAASCSSHVDARAFVSTLDDAALGRDDLRLLELYGPPPDHPTTPSWAEGRYLKFAVLA